MGFLKKVIHIVYKIFPDKIYLQWIFFRRFHCFINWKNPKGFNEKIQWLKIYDRKKLYGAFADKAEVKIKIADMIGKEYIIPTYGVWNRVADIDYDMLPESFVIKCTHDSGSVIFCTDKSRLDRNAVETKLKAALRENLFWAGREWVYKNIQPRIIAEKYIAEPREELKDYKVFVFNGKAQYIQVDFDRYSNHRRNFYDREWNYVPFTTCYPTDPFYKIEKPLKLEEMMLISEKIAHELEDIVFIRVDLYLVKNHIYFGETTFYHGGGQESFYPPEYDLILGKLIELKGRGK